ncbi:MAG: hypothetical protein JO353_13645 [Phycisphaerae bacterium]|nr:hypothetical protein [Phycisphaerae bacterium]
MRNSWCYAAVLAVGMFIVGCGMQPGTTLVKYSKGSGTTTTTAPHDAMYALYSTDDATPIVKYPLKAGDKIGFTENADGTVTAVAGTNQKDIQTSMLAHTYYWKEQK